MGGGGGGSGGSGGGSGGGGGGSNRTSGHAFGMYICIFARLCQGKKTEEDELVRMLQ